MAQIEVNTTELYKSGENIVGYTNTLNQQFNQMFKRIDEVPTVTKEWIGTSSIKFANLVNSEKDKYYKFKEDLTLYGKFLCEVSLSLEDSINYIKGRL